MTLALLKTAYEKFFQLKVCFKMKFSYLLFTNIMMINFPARTIDSEADKVQRIKRKISLFFSIYFLILFIHDTFEIIKLKKALKPHCKDNFF